SRVLWRSSGSQARPAFRRMAFGPRGTWFDRTSALGERGATAPRSGCLERHLDRGDAPDVVRVLVDAPVGAEPAHAGDVEQRLPRPALRISRVPPSPPALRARLRPAPD